MDVSGRQFRRSSVTAGTGRTVTGPPCADSEELGMPRIRALLAVTLLVLSCASCSGDPGGAEPGGLPISSTSTPTTATSPRPTVPPYLVAYTANERQAYADALVAEDAFNVRNARYLAKGQTVEEASDFYHRYSIDWVQDWTNLAELANNHVTVTGKTSVVWVRPLRIKLSTAGGVDFVFLRRCVDSSKLVVTQNGEPLEQSHLEKRHVVRVRMEKRAGETWWRSGISQQGPSC